jgi:hydrogenase/urease accessory protein HupE
MPVLIKLLTSFSLLILLHTQSMAHEGRPVYIQVNVQDLGVVDVRWKIPPVMVSGQEPRIILQGNDCQRIRLDSLNGSDFNTRTLNRLSGHNQYQCLISNNSPMRVVLTYPDNNPVLSSLIRVQKKDGPSYSLFNGPDIVTIILPKKVTLIDVAQQYIQGGFLHILSGFDHLLFVLCLMLIAQGKRALFLTITGFTLGHSITLGLASLNMVNVHINVVEVLIALSIVMLIVEITKAAFGGYPQSVIWRYPVIVSLGFGLLHGFGFASALGEFGLPANMKISALVFFNIGIELGQLAFIVIVLGLINLTSYVYLNIFNQNITLPERMTFGGGGRMHFSIIFLYTIGSLSCYWFLDRSISLFI